MRAVLATLILACGGAVVIGGLPVTLVTRNTRSGPQMEAATQFVLDQLREQSANLE